MIKKHIVQHTGLPLPDLFVDYMVRKDIAIVRVSLGDHFDSELLIDFVRLLEKNEGIRIIDNESHANWTPAKIKDQFALEVVLGHQIYDAEIMQLMSLGQNMQQPPKIYGQYAVKEGSHG